MGAPRKRQKRVDARTAPARQGARTKARQAPAKGHSQAEMQLNERLLFVEHLLRSFKETDLPHATRRALGMGPRATKQAVEAVRQKWVVRSRHAPGEAMRTRELANIDEIIRAQMFDKKGRVLESAILDMPSIVKLLQLRDKVTERLLKNEDQFRKPGGYMGAHPDLSGAKDLRGRDDFKLDSEEE